MHKNVLAALFASGLLAGAPLAQAANLVFCSEGSPAGFDPAQYTTGTDWDASAETVFNELVQFERGGTQVDAGGARFQGRLERTVIADAAVPWPASVSAAMH